MPARVGSDLRDKPEERAALLAEVTDWFANPDDGPCSLNLVCAHLGFNAEAWSYQVRRYLSNPRRHAIVLGRKNRLFAGSEAAAHRTAILFSLVQTCKHLQINPFVYLRDVVERVSTHSARLVLELTPREWKRVRHNSRAEAAA